MTTLEETFEQFKQLPDWNKYPMPEVFYEHFKVAKPKPSNSIMDALAYIPPLSQPLTRKPEIRDSVPGGVREIKDLQVLPVEVKLLDDDTGELKEYPEPTPITEKEKLGLNENNEYKYQPLPFNYMPDEAFLKAIKEKTADGSLPSWFQVKSNLPTVDNTIGNQPELGPQ